jgi:hypothetical protein
MPSLFPSQHPRCFRHASLRLQSASAASVLAAIHTGTIHDVHFLEKKNYDFRFNITAGQLLVLRFNIRVRLV